MKFDDLIVNYLGEFGPYQKLQFFLVCLPTVFTAMHALSWTFSGATPPHRCRLPSELTVNASYWLDDPAKSKLFNVQHCDLGAHPEMSKCPYDQCSMRSGKPCEWGYVYDLSEFHYPAVYKWEIVCDRSVLKAVIQSMYYVGQMAGSLVFGFLGDRIGRKRVFLIAIAVQIVCGLGMVVAPHWIVFSLFRAGVGFAHPGIFVIAVVIGMELVGPSKRKLGSIFTGTTFAVGQIILGVLAYLIRDYRWLQAAIALPSVVFLVYWWVIPESARWLVSQRRYAEADTILRRVARVNKGHLPDKWWEEVKEDGGGGGSGDNDGGGGGNSSGGEEKEDMGGRESPPGESQRLKAKSSDGEPHHRVASERKQHNFTDLLRTPRMRHRSLAVFFCWPVVSLVYYGVSMNTSFLGGDFYSTFVFGAFMEIPAILVVYTVVDVLGRRALLAAGYSITALCMFSNLGWSALSGSSSGTGGNGEAAVPWLVALLQFLVAKGAITATYATLYMFTPELFPTVIRNQGMGVSSMMARVGAIASSYISMWLVERYGKVAMILPFASLALAAAFVALTFLPETKGRPMPETIEEVEEEGEVGAGEGRKLLELQPLASTAGASAPPCSEQKAAAGKNE